MPVRTYITAKVFPTLYGFCCKLCSGYPIEISRSVNRPQEAIAAFCQYLEHGTKPAWLTDSKNQFSLSSRINITQIRTPRQQEQPVVIGSDYVCLVRLLGPPARDLGTPNVPARLIMQAMVIPSGKDGTCQRVLSEDQPGRVFCSISIYHLRCFFIHCLKKFNC